MKPFNDGVYSDTTIDDFCYECTGYGDDYYIDENGELVCACDDCPFNIHNKENE